MFRGTFQTTIDDRGSVRVPRRFVDTFRATNDEQLVVTADPSGGFRRLSLRPLSSWIALEHRIQEQLRARSMDVQFTRFVNYFVSNAEETSIDSRGRIRVPRRLREYAGLFYSVTWTGVLQHIAIWNTETFNLGYSADLDRFSNSGLTELVGGLSLDDAAGPAPVGQIEVISVTRDLMSLLRTDMNAIHGLSPDEFERFVAESIERMGLRATRIGNVYAADGGVDIIACPADASAYPFILAVQVKHHRKPTRKTSAPEVQQFAGTLAAQRLFNAGMLVTSTTFTPNALAVAKQLPTLKLRDFRDLTRWVAGNLHEHEWREMPARIELFPGHFIDVPQPPFSSR